MKILIIANTLTILYILFFKYFEFNLSYEGKIIVGFRIWYKNKNIINIPLRNRDKISKRNDILYMINNPQVKRQHLHAKLSWLKTKEEINIFRNDYSIVDKKFVNKICDEKINIIFK